MGLLENTGNNREQKRGAIEKDTSENFEVLHAIRCSSAARFVVISITDIMNLVLYMYSHTEKTHASNNAHQGNMYQSKPE